MSTSNYQEDSRIDRQVIVDLESCGIISPCFCPYCEGVKYISYAKSYRFGKTKYYICVKNLNDYCLISFWHGCQWGIGYPTSGLNVAEGLIECGEYNILYHLDFFRS